LRRTRNQKGRKNSLQLLCPAVHKLEHLIELGGKEVQRGYNPPVWPQLVATLAEKEKKFDFFKNFPKSHMAQFTKSHSLSTSIPALQD